MKCFKNSSRFLCLFLLVICLCIEPRCCQPGLGQRFLSSSFGNSSDIASQNGSALKQTQANDTTVSTRDFFGIFGKLGTSWHTILQIFQNIVNAAGGQTFHHDVQLNTLEEGREWLYQQDDWRALLSPHAELYKDLGYTIDDLLDSFLRWATADEAPDDEQSCQLQGGINGKDEKVNVSKALRRLERYVAWMKKLEKDLTSLTAKSVKTSFDIFDMKLTVDGCHRLVWWLDLQAIDWGAFQTLKPRDIARIFVWISHYMMFHPNAQEYGMVFVNSLNQIGFWSFMTMLPVDLGMQLDEFTIAVIPLKTKFVVLMDRPPWAKFAYQLLKPFLQNKMRRRVIVIEDGQYPESYMYQVVGQMAIPVGLANYQGSSTADIIHPFMNEKVRRNHFHYFSFS